MQIKEHFLNPILQKYFSDIFVYMKKKKLHV